MLDSLIFIFGCDVDYFESVVQTVEVVATEIYSAKGALANLLEALVDAVEGEVGGEVVGFLRGN